MSFTKREKKKIRAEPKEISLCRVILIRLKVIHFYPLAGKSQKGRQCSIRDATMRYAERVLNIAMLNITYVITL